MQGSVQCRYMSYLISNNGGHKTWHCSPHRGRADQRLDGGDQESGPGADGDASGDPLVKTAPGQVITGFMETGHWG